MNNYYNHEKSGETKLNEDTIKNLNDFYVKSSLGDCNGIFNLSNFYMNHGKYFAGNNGSFSNSYNFQNQCYGYGLQYFSNICYFADY